MFIAAAAIPGSSLTATETTTFAYDTLGRLITSATTGTVNNGVNSATIFDRAGNRVNYSVTGVSGIVVPTISIGSASTTEGGTLQFVITRTGSTAVSNSVNYASADGTAVAGSDYTAASGTITFAVGETSRLISISTVDDAVNEPNETMTVSLTSPTGGAVVSPAVATGTILDNDPILPVFSISSASTTEGGTLVFTVTKTGATNSIATVNYASADGTASSLNDYVGTAGGSLIFLPTETTKTISVATKNDVVNEFTETMTLNLSSPNGATLGIASGTGTIFDDDPAPSFSVYPGGTGAVIEGGSLTFNIGMDGATSGTTYSVNYSTADGTATAGSDYVPASGTLTFQPYEVKTVTINTIDDSTVESNETVYLNLSGATGGTTISVPQAYGTIYDNEPTGPSPPVTAPDTLSLQKCSGGSINVLANDSDPNGHYPLVLVSFTHTKNSTVTIVGTSTIDYQSSGGGIDIVTYTVRNSVGATAQGTLTVTISGGTCTGTQSLPLPGLQSSE
jgi:hypothetical protein